MNIDMNGAEMISAERQRQIDAEGWSPDHDDDHVYSELTDAAISYLFAALHGTSNSLPDAAWPWDAEFWKPSDDPIRNLTKAGALIAAEIDRLLRARGGEG